MALAGSGKTTTLLRLAEKYEKDRKLKFLFVVFNKAVAEEARGRFPNNVTCKTIHSLACHHVLHRYGKKKIANIYSSNLIDKSILQHRPSYQQEKQILDTIGRFWCSSAENITVDHTPNTVTKRSRGGEINEIALSVDERMASTIQAFILILLLKAFFYLKGHSS